ncbi:Hopanoid C-3 methylase [Fundidesulfovibrio magnetotacticus]|uniref:Hopanoid C-3 methylase n=1 Tax=Fundidesulfovibrio magnetotacticus TaxID=2730080 RepID=A0A6V8LW55_9BACT|nr:radical SAM protein [Fundidesulfovibrio magnetotacticus]GFK94831.1 Hopanoid C-3 methylase [Fundidesulfovibrio magnetotacticus]
MKSKILLIYPPLGLSGVFVRHPPTSLIHAASYVNGAGYNVDIFDARIHPNNWKYILQQYDIKDYLLCGISVMSGPPVKHAAEISSLIKSIAPDSHVVLGGPAASFTPESLLHFDPNADFVISGYGAKPLLELANCLSVNTVPENIPGIYYRTTLSTVTGTPPDWSAHELLSHDAIPYHLIPDYSPYGQLDNKQRIFSIYSSIGCPYHCAFCSSPALYNRISGRKWLPIPAGEVVDHIEYLIQKYQAEYIYFIDDDSFVDLKHVDKIIDLINQRNIRIRLGFRGARINEIKKMSHDFLDKLAAAGTDILHIGAETGSDRLLKLIRKDCTVNDIIQCNIKLSKHKQIFSFYNFILGIPTESISDLNATSKLMLRLVDDNPQCIISTPNVFRPLPGTELYKIARETYNYSTPNSLDELAKLEVETNFNLPWISRTHQNYMRMMLLSSYFVDNKIEKMNTGSTALISILKTLNTIYKPLARLRLKYGLHQFLLEDMFYRLAQKILTKPSL